MINIILCYLILDVLCCIGITITVIGLCLAFLMLLALHAPKIDIDTDTLEERRRRRVDKIMSNLEKNFGDGHGNIFIDLTPKDDCTKTDNKDWKELKWVSGFFRWADVCQE